jgi:hypothetical protein
LKESLVYEIDAEMDGGGRASYTSILFLLLVWLLVIILVSSLINFVYSIKLNI